MRQIVSILVFVGVLGAAVAMFNPALFDALRGKNSNDTAPAAPAKNWKDSSSPSPQLDRDLEDFERQVERSQDQMRDMRLQQLEAQIDNLEQAERDCYAAARRPGGTDGRCRGFADRIRAAEDRLRDARNR